MAIKELKNSIDPDNPKASDQSKLAELRDRHKRAVSEQQATKAKLDALDGVKPASALPDDVPTTRKPQWVRDDFDARRWAQQVLESDPAELPPLEHFRLLDGAERKALAARLTDLADTAPLRTANRLLAIAANVGPQPEPVRAMPAAPAPISSEEVRTARLEADEATAAPAAPGTPLEVRLDEPPPATTAGLLIPTDTPPDEVWASAPLTSEDADALRELDSVAPAYSEPAHPLERAAAQADLDAAARESARAAGNEPPPAGPLRDGSGEYAPRPNGPATAVYGATTSSKPKWKGVLADLAGWFAAYSSVVPEIPASVRKLSSITEGYKALLRGQEVAVHNAERKVAHILEPIMALDNPVDPAARKKLHALRIEQVALEAELRRITSPSADKAPDMRVVADMGRRIHELHRLAVAQADSMRAQPLAIFENFILWRDLMHRAKTLTNAKGEPIELPYGVNEAEAEAEASAWADRLANHPQSSALREAVRRHEAVVAATWADFESRNLFGVDPAADALRAANIATERCRANIARLEAKVSARVQNWRMFDGLLRKERRRLAELETAEAKAAEEAKARRKYPVWNGGRSYFPHILPEHSQGKPDRVGLTAAAAFRSYLVQPVGSTKAIETDYAKAMFIHLASVEANNLQQDVVRRDFASHDQTAALESEVGEMGADAPSVAALARQRGLVEYSPDEHMRMAMAPTIDREQLSRALGRVLDDSPLADQLAALAKDGVRLRPEHIQEQLVAVGKEKWWVEPRVADALRAIEKEQNPPGHWQKLLGSAEYVNRHWKKYILYFPHNYPRYEFNNTVSDTGKLAAMDPAAFRHMGEAFSEVRKFFRGETVHPDTAAAFRLGVFNTPTTQEIEDLRNVPEFDDKLLTDGEKIMRRLLGWAGKDWHKFSAYREATYRLAKFNADLARLRSGETPAYGGAYWKDIEALGESSPGAGDAHERKAAAISLATLNDYAAISRTGAHLRKILVPFWSFTENNLRGHINLLRNLYDMTARGDMTRSAALASGATATATLTARAALGIAGNLVLPMLALALWNNAIGGDDELSDEDRRRLHINLGRDASGRRRVLYLENEFVAFLRWFGGNRAMASAIEVWRGDTTLATAAKDWAEHLPSDFMQTAASVGPIPRAVALVATDREIGMDILNPRTVHGKDKTWALVKEAVGMVPADAMRSALDKDYYSNADLGDWLQQTILQIRRRDPEQWSYYAMREKAEQFHADKTGKASERGTSSAPETVALRSFRRAIFQGDIPAALELRDTLLRYGYTADRLQASLRNIDPLGPVPKAGPGNRAEFVASLTEGERRELSRAYLYAERMHALDGKAHLLFPRKTTNADTAAERARSYANDPSKREAMRAALQEQADQDADARALDSAMLERKSMRKAR